MPSGTRERIARVSNDSSWDPFVLWLIPVAVVIVVAIPILVVMLAHRILRRMQ